jgi:hypothetical protein
MHYSIQHRTSDRQLRPQLARVAELQTRSHGTRGSNDAHVRFPPVILTGGCDSQGVLKDFEHRYRDVRGRDIRFDGWFCEAVTSTGIDCCPSCPAVTPKRFKKCVAHTIHSRSRTFIRSPGRSRLPSRIEPGGSPNGFRERTEIRDRSCAHTRYRTDLPRHQIDLRLPALRGGEAELRDVVSPYS